MQGVLTAAKLPSGSTLSKVAVQAATSRAGVFAAKQQGIVTQPRTLPRSQSAAHVAASAAVAEPSSAQPVAPVTLPPPSRKVKKSINDSTFMFKFIVPDTLVGAFLGRGGGNVNRVKEETGVYVQFTKPGTAVNSERDRMLILAADTVEQGKQAVAMLLDGVAQVDGALTRLRSPQSGERLFFQQVIPAMCAGNIMGPAGETIKGIGFRTGSSLLVEPKLANAAFIPFRIVDFASPDAASLAAAVGEVMERLVQDEKYIEGIREVQSVCMRIIKIPHLRVGAILGPGGAHVKTLQEMLKVKIGVSEPNGPDPETRYVTLWGAPLNVKVAIDVVLLTTGQLQTEIERRAAANERQQHSEWQLMALEQAYLASGSSTPRSVPTVGTPSIAGSMAGSQGQRRRRRPQQGQGQGQPQEVLHGQEVHEQEAQEEVVAA
ncbi:hypothetical protein N2152v2_010098 [Parachlorella kessleri]